jgi:hypothetical protein
MNEKVVLVAIGLVVAAFVLRPLLRGRGSPTRPAGPDAARGGVIHPTAPDELAELELDRSMGRVSEADYERWRGELEADIESGATGATGATGTEGAAGTVRAEALVRKWREAPRPTCPKCGLRPEPEARFCSNCGSAL